MVLMKIPSDEIARSWATIRTRRNHATIRTWCSLFCETGVTSLSSCYCDHSLHGNNTYIITKWPDDASVPARPTHASHVLFFFLTRCHVDVLVPSHFTLHVQKTWGVEVRWFHDRSSQDLPNSSELSVWISFALCDGSRNFRKLFSVSCEVFEWQDLVPRQRTGDCLEIHLPCWGLCDQPLSSHQTFLPDVLFPQCVFCKEPLWFWFACRLRKFGPSGSEYEYCAYLISLPLFFCRTFRIWVLRNVCGCRRFWIFQTTVNSSNHSRTRNRFPDAWLLSPFFLFGFFWEVNWIATVSCCPIVTSLVGWTCWHVDVDDELLPERVDKPGTTRSTKLSVLHINVFSSLVTRGFWLLTHSSKSFVLPRLSAPLYWM